MSLTEKTLELNVTHELLVLGQGVATVFWGGVASLPGVPPPAGPPLYAAGLTLRQEARRGWDVSIELPAVGATPPRLVFLQFKLGAARAWSNHSRTRFGPGPWSRHVLFGINNNGASDQHVRLRATARRLGAPRAAIYALPLVTDERAAKSRAGRLLARTVFLTVPDVDAQATPAIVTGTPRKIAISTTNSAWREVRSDPQTLDAEDVGARLVGQVAAVRLHREMVAWRGAILQGRDDDGDGRAGGRRGRRLAFRLVRYLAYYLGVPESDALRGFGLIGGDRRDQPALDFDLQDELTVAFARPERAGRVRRGVEDPGGALGRAGLAMVVKHARPLVAALASGTWLEEVPPLGELDLLAEVDGRLRFEIEGADLGTGSSRLTYLVV